MLDVAEERFYGWECPRCGAVYGPSVIECWRCCPDCVDCEECDEVGDTLAALPPESIVADGEHVCVVYNLAAYREAKNQQSAGGGENA